MSAHPYTPITASTQFSSPCRSPTQCTPMRPSAGMPPLQLSDSPMEQSPVGAKQLVRYRSPVPRMPARASMLKSARPHSQPQLLWNLQTT